MKELYIPYPQVKRKRQYEKLLKQWHSMDETDRAMHILSNSEEYQWANQAEKFLIYYAETYLQ